MFYFKKNNIVINKTQACKDIGITRVYLTNILNKRIACSKVVAFCITKYLDNNAEIEDYFERKT